jgi:hypothetical protein
MLKPFPDPSGGHAVGSDLDQQPEDIQAGFLCERRNCLNCV